MVNMNLNDKDLAWWRDKVSRRGEECFNRSIGRWASHALDRIVALSDTTITANDLEELAIHLDIPSKYITRAIATLTRSGIVTADLRSKPALLVHIDTFTKRKASAQKSRGSIPKSFRKRLFEADGYQCAHCKEVFDSNDLHIDHIVPISLLGADEPGNWVTLCSKCNIEKRDKFLRDYFHLFRQRPVFKNIQVRFNKGYFYPTINGALQSETRDEWSKINKK